MYDTTTTETEQPPMTLSRYQQFLETKRRNIQPTGITVTIDDIHPMLHDWQKHVTQWLLARGRAAIFADCGLGKTFMQIEWGRLIAPRCLIVAPLSVARQTVREAERLGVTVTYARTQTESAPTGLTITNYEMLDKFNVPEWPAVILDESSILKNVDSTTRRKITEATIHVPYRLACTATPAPNDVSELCNHAEFLGAMPRNEMLAAYFIHDDEGWRPKGHALTAMYEWMASWSVALRKPSDLGWPDDGYDLPPLDIIAESVEVELTADGQLFPTELGGIGGRSAVRRETLNDRVDRTIDIINTHPDDQWIVWCGLNDEAHAVLAGLGDDAVNVPGSWAPEQKADALEAFQDGHVRVLITKPSIAGFGMNFQNAHRMVFVGLSDSWESYYQAIRRCWRFGQQHPVNVHIVVSELEQQIVHNVARKEVQSQTTATALSSFSHVRNN